MYVTRYVPGVLVSTILEPLSTIFGVISRSSVSFAVAHASTYAGSQTSRKAGLGALIVITGISPVVTLTVRILSVAIFHAQSVILYLRV